MAQSCRYFRHEGVTLGTNVINARNQLARAEKKRCSTDIAEKMVENKPDKVNI